MSLQQSLERFEQQQSDPQTAGNSIDAFEVCYWQKIEAMKQAGVAIPQGITRKQLVETTIDLIKQGYVYCCDVNHPSGYRALVQIDCIGLSEAEIKIKQWAEYAVRMYSGADDHSTVNSIRHNFTPYQAWLNRGDDYLTAFMRANMMIAERCPQLAKVAIDQIGIKRKKFEYS